MKSKEKLPAVFILSLPIILIIASTMAHQHISILGSPIYLYAFIYPLTYLFSCWITKKTDLKSALNAMATTLVLQTVVFVLNWIFFNIMDAYLMIYTFLAFFLEQLILIFTYDFLVKIKKDTFMSMFLLLLFVSAINNIFFGAFIEGYCLSLSILPRLAYVVILPAVLARNDKKTK